jgi:hypothetical protein
MKIIATAVALTLFSLTPAMGSGESIGSVSHIHSVRLLNDKVLLGTHTGLYQYIDAKTVKRISSEKFDVMGLSILGGNLYASGHPGPGSKLPEPVGLLLSTNLGKSWKKISLQGKVDFHLLESANSEIYGADSQSGNILYSSNLGTSWTSRGQNSYSDLAINPLTKGSILGLRQGKLYSSGNSLKTTKQIKIPEVLNFIEWNSQRLIAASGEKLLISSDEGQTWTTLFTFPENIGTITQSRKSIAVVIGSEIYISRNSGKSFVKL